MNFCSFLLLGNKMAATLATDIKNTKITKPLSIKTIFIYFFFQIYLPKIIFLMHTLI